MEEPEVAGGCSLHEDMQLVKLRPTVSLGPHLALNLMPGSRTWMVIALCLPACPLSHPHHLFPAPPSSTPAPVALHPHQDLEPIGQLIFSLPLTPHVPVYLFPRLHPMGQRAVIRPPASLSSFPGKALPSAPACGELSQAGEKQLSSGFYHKFLVSPGSVWPPSSLIEALCRPGQLLLSLRGVLHPPAHELASCFSGDLEANRKASSTSPHTYQMAVPVDCTLT